MFPSERNDAPTIVIIPGQWHVPEHYDNLVAELLAIGYPVVCVQLPSCDSTSPGLQSIQRDADQIRHLLELENEFGGPKQFVVVMHSYGAVPGSIAIKGFSELDRFKQMLPGGVIGVVMMCGVLVPFPMPTLEHLDLLGPWSVIENGQVRVNSESLNPGALLYNRCQPEVSEWAVARLKPHSANVFSTPVSNLAGWTDEYYEQRRAYITCHEDKYLPYAAQSQMINNSGVGWKQLVLPEGDHAPWLSRPEYVVKYIDNLAKRWIGQQPTPRSRETDGGESDDGTFGGLRTPPSERPSP